MGCQSIQQVNPSIKYSDTHLNNWVEEFAFWSRVEGKWSRVKGKWSRVKGNWLRVKVNGRGLKNSSQLLFFEHRQIKISCLLDLTMFKNNCEEFFDPRPSTIYPRPLTSYPRPSTKRQTRVERGNLATTHL